MEETSEQEEIIDNTVTQEAPEIIQDNIPQGQGASLLRSLTGLLVGGALVGWEELISRVEQWEEEASKTADSQVEPREVIIIDGEVSDTPPAPESSARLVRLALVGMLFDTQSRIVNRTTSVIKSADRGSKRTLSPLSRRLGRTRLAKSAQQRFDSLVSRGETVTQQWIERGRIEDAYSRRLVKTAAQDSFDDSMDQLGQAPALQSLVKQQSAGLTQEVLDEVRVKTVSGDVVLEDFVRSLLRRGQRRDLPAPPTANEDSEQGQAEGGDA